MFRHRHRTLALRYYRERGPGSGTYITYLHNTDNVVELDTVPLILMEHGSLYTEVYVIISTHKKKWQYLCEMS